jgi:pimeloyl-ACP methyl ester carboxylesterase
VGPPRRSEGDLSRFPPGIERRVVPGVGHFMPREEPTAVVDALLKVLR